jgi:hypothetical protein
MFFEFMFLLVKLCIFYCIIFKFYINKKNLYSINKQNVQNVKVINKNINKNQSNLICDKKLKEKYVYMKIETFKPIPIYVNSYLNKNCKLDKKGLILTKYFFRDNEYNPLLEYSKIPLLYEIEFKYIWLSFIFNVTNFNENIKIKILDKYRYFSGFYLKNHKINMLHNNNLKIIGFNNINKKKDYFEYSVNNYTKKFSGYLHTINMNLTRYKDNINYVYIKLKYNK